VSVFALRVVPRHFFLFLGSHHVFTGAWVLRQLHQQSACEERQLLILLMKDQEWYEIILKELPLAEDLLDPWIEIALIPYAPV